MKTKTELIVEDIKERCEELIKLVEDSEQNRASVVVDEYAREKLIITNKEARIEYQYGKDFFYIRESKEINWGCYGIVEVQRKLISGGRKINRKIKQTQKLFNKALKNRIVPQKARRARRVKGLIAVMIAATVIGTATAAHFLGIIVTYNDSQITISREVAQ